MEMQAPREFVQLNFPWELGKETTIYLKNQ